MRTLFILLLLVSSYSLAIPALVGKKAPDFQAQAVVDNEIKKVSLNDFKGQNKLLIFYPADFSFICPTELKSVQEKLASFKERNTIPLAISVDQVYTHQKWLETPTDQGGIKGITYPILSDVKKEIAIAYGVLDESEGIALRGTFIIDENDIIQAAIIYNLETGRNIDEILRILDALTFTKSHGQICPANWQKDENGMQATQAGLKKYLENQRIKKSNQKKEKNEY